MSRHPPPRERGRGAHTHSRSHQASSSSSCSSTKRLHSKSLLPHRPSTISSRRTSLQHSPPTCGQRLSTAASPGPTGRQARAMGHFSDKDPRQTHQLGMGGSWVPHGDLNWRERGVRGLSILRVMDGGVGSPRKPLKWAGPHSSRQTGSHHQCVWVGLWAQGASLRDHRVYCGEGEPTGQ